MMAGLLTYSLFEAFPISWISVAKEVSKKLNGGSQQQDCSGFSPDSLLIHILKR